MKCISCRVDASPGTTTDVTDLGHSLIIVRNVPCYKCRECNEIIYTGEVVKRLEKIIFIADAIEPNRTGDDADEARNAAKNDLDKALAPVMRIKTYYLQGKPMHPNSVKMLKKYK